MFKHKVYNWLKDDEAEQGHSSQKSLKIGSKSTRTGSLQ